ncbi:MAG: RsmB/NOP family class I SAM-dependent RNA methyltransferase [Magnetovibrio sp.]|nr:RsmB/NOP family class I SAM-dependent RNA methyltransferase [Magnetovibrio sp.]
MTPGARAQAAIELLTAVWDGATPPDVLTDAYFRKRRYAGSGDRRAITAQVYNVLRRRARLDWWIERTGLGLEPGPRNRVIADLAVAERTAPDDLAALFSGARHCPAAMSEAETALADSLYGRPLRHRDMPRPVAFEYPGWMDASFTALWGDNLETEIAALNQPAPVDLRVNTLKATPEQAQESLAQAFIEAQPTPLSPLGLRVDGHPRLGGTEAFKRGYVEIQDEGSQLLALLVGARPGMTVVDFCAGAGGKTLALAAAMAGDGGISGRLFGCDVSANRMERMQGRIKRAGAFGVKRRTIAARDDNWVRENAGRADRVLADVPCTGTGTWRRDVNAKWRFQPTDLDELKAIQQRILADAGSLVKPGGRLVYATCSLLQEENEQQLGWLVENHPEFEPLAMPDVWAETVGGPAPPAGPCLRLSPATTGTDGFFCAVLERRK